MSRKLVVNNWPYSAEAATRPNRGRWDLSEFPFSHLALAIRAENDRNGGCDPLNGRDKVPVPAAVGNWLWDENRVWWDRNFFLTNEIEVIRCYRSYRAVGPTRPRLRAWSAASPLSKNVAQWCVQIRIDDQRTLHPWLLNIAEETIYDTHVAKHPW